MSPKPQIHSLKKKQQSPAATTATDTTAASETVTKPETQNPTAATTDARAASLKRPLSEQQNLAASSVDTQPTTLSVTEPAPENVTTAKTETQQSAAPPLLESETKTSSASDAELETEKPMFQAIGTLQTKPELDEEGKFFVRLGGKRYGLFIAGYRYQAWLKQMAEHPGATLFLRVYPKCLMIPRQDPIIYFQVAAWEDTNAWDEEPGIFRFRGLWQFVPQVRTPVISIYRNHNAKDPKGKFKAAHLPVLMRREDGANPFRFNPKIAKEDLPPRWFIQANFRFMTSRDCWGWVEDLEPPTLDIPWYKKPKKDVTGQQEKVSVKTIEKPKKKLTKEDSTQ